MNCSVNAPAPTPTNSRLHTLERDVPHSMRWNSMIVMTKQATATAYRRAKLGFLSNMSKGAK